VQHRFRIPTFLQLHALGFHKGTGKQGGDVDRKRHGADGDRMMGNSPLTANRNRKRQQRKDLDPTRQSGRDVMDGRAHYQHRLFSRETGFRAAVGQERESIRDPRQEFQKEFQHT